jgi:predicted SprT family Zn-dependent metalloprotease
VIPVNVLIKWRELREEYEEMLTGWSLVEDFRSTKVLGRCKYRERIISISHWLIEKNGQDCPQIMDTFLHEVAHILCDESGHGEDWKRWARKIGAVPEALVDLEKAGVKSLRYVADCPTCGKRWDVGRKVRKRRYCPCQGSNGMFKNELHFEAV